MKDGEQVAEKIRQLLTGATDAKEVKGTLDEIERLMRRRRLKREIVRQLESNSGRRQWVTILRHPLLIVMVSFTVTGILGAEFSSCVQTREWVFQQSHQAYQHKIDTKYALVTEVSNSVASSLTAAEDVLVMMQTPYTATERRTELSERKHRWYESSREWRVASTTIAPRLSAYFGSSDIDSIFRALCSERLHIGNSINYALWELSVNFERGQADSNRRTSTQGRINNAKEQLRQLTAKMIGLIHQDEAAARNPDSISVRRPGGLLQAPDQSSASLQHGNALDCGGTMTEILTLITLALTLAAIIWYTIETRELRKTAQKQMRLGVDQHYNEIGFRPCRDGDCQRLAERPRLRARSFRNVGQLAINVDLVDDDHDPRIELEKGLGIVAPNGTIKLIFPDDLDVSRQDYFFIGYNDVQGNRREIRMKWKKDSIGWDAYPIFDSDVRTLI